MQDAEIHSGGVDGGLLEHISIFKCFMSTGKSWNETSVACFMGDG